MIDLHIHSAFSDGDHCIKDIVEMAKTKSIDIMSITDHDNIESVEYLNSNIRDDCLFVPGVELSSESFYFGEKMKVHLLGYGFDDNSIIKDRLKLLYNSRAKDNRIYIEKIVKLFNFLSLDMFDNFDYGKYGWIWKLIIQHISSIINENEIDILQKHLISNKPKYNSYNIDIEEAINIINRCGGYPVIAHPFSLKLSDNNLVDFIKYLKRIGLKGIETYHNQSTLLQSQLYHNLAIEYELYETGGSDFHKGNLELVYNELNCDDNQFVRKLILENKTIGGKYGDR